MLLLVEATGSVSAWALLCLPCLTLPNWALPFGVIWNDLWCSTVWDCVITRSYYQWWWCFIHARSEWLTYYLRGENLSSLDGFKWLSWVYKSLLSNLVIYPSNQIVKSHWRNESDLFPNAVICSIYIPPSLSPRRFLQARPIQRTSIFPLKKSNEKEKNSRLNGDWQWPVQLTFALLVSHPLSIGSSPG